MDTCINPKKTNKKKDSDGVHKFLEDMVPFFYGRSLTYVDVGAFKGEVFLEIIKSQLAVQEVHLFEPNPLSFEMLNQSINSDIKLRSLNLYNAAVSSSPGQLRMKAAKSMTKVIEEVEPHVNNDESRINEDSSFVVKCVTLDQISEKFTENHVDILKIDVEGFEPDVLKGAEELLSKQKIDVIYIEAGANPEGVQQSYHRVIDDLLKEKGYRLFRIYEQKHEWKADSPILRRMNLAYFSMRFADSNPYKLTNEIYDLKRKNLELSAELESCKSEIKKYNNDINRIKSTSIWKVIVLIKKSKKLVYRLFNLNQ